MNRRLLIGMKWSAIIFLWCIFLAASAYLFINDNRWDWDYFYYTSVRILQQNSIYALDPHIASHYLYIYPPFLAQVLLPIAHFFDYDTASWLWFGVNVVLLILTVMIIARESSSIRSAPAIVWLVPVLFQPLLRTFWLGQSSIVLLFCVTAAWYAARYNRFLLVGIFLAVGAWIKILPILLIGYFILKRQWKVLWGALFATIFILMFQIAISGIDPLVTYFTEVLPELNSAGEARLLFRNSSILGFTYKLIMPGDGIIPLVNYPSLGPILRWGMTAVIFGVMGWLFLSRNETGEAACQKRRFDYEYAVMVIGMMLFGSTLYLEGMAPVMFSFTLLLVYGMNRIGRMFYVIAFVFVSLYWPIELGIYPDDRIPALLLSLPFIGIMIVWYLLVYRLRQICFDK